MHRKFFSNAFKILFLCINPEENIYKKCFQIITISRLNVVIYKILGRWEYLDEKKFEN